MQLRDPRHTGRPVSFGLPAGADTDKLFVILVGSAADLLAQERKTSRAARAGRPTGPSPPLR